MEPLERVEMSTALGVPAAEMWSRATELEGVNYELGPLLRMTAPRALRGATIGDLEPGVPAGRSWLLLGGVLPVDYDDLCLVEIEPPRRFLERSRMASMAVWEHERTIEPLGAHACRVTDRLGFTLRRVPGAIPGAAAVARRIVAALFGHRHRRLVAAHGSAEPR
jgi:hypothetical protein